METDRAYYARRAAEQRRVAAKAANADTRRRHLAVAALLSERGQGVPAHP